MAMIKGWIRSIRSLAHHIWHRFEVTWIAHSAHIFLGLACVVIFVTWVRPVPQGLEAIKSDGRLVILTRLAPTTFYHGTTGRTGFEYLLTQALGEKLGVSVEYRSYDTVPDVLGALRERKGHIAAAGLMAENDFGAGLKQSKAYYEVTPLLVCRREIPRPKKMADLAGLKIWVSTGTVPARALEDGAINVEGLDLVYADQPVEVLLAAASSGNIDCTTANSLEFRINNPYFLNLVEAFPLGKAQKLSWYFAPGSEDLAGFVNKWIEEYKKSGKLEDATRRFAGFLPPFDYVDIRAFQRAVETTLPEYESTIRAAAREAGLPWQLVAAVAYQESHWKPDARSHTGVRGIMMLTATTAEHLGVEDRLDPVESLHAGARYIADLKARIPEEVRGPDRLWFALAAYNMGYAHMLDARALAEGLGLDKNRWTDLRRALSIMDKPGYASRLKYGRARGGQALRFVQQVRAYQHILDDPY